jgi:Leucine-rich repeat (LRR) protein
MKKTLLISFVVFAFVNSGWAQITASEYQALMDLYQSTNGANWTNKTGWSTADPNVVQSVQGWYGIATDANGHITKLYLGGNNLTGTIPSSIGNLFMLNELLLQANNLSGTIPGEIGSLTNLYNLFLFYNQLSGSIPSSIGSLTNLNSLLLYNNQLTGSIPTTIGGLVNLTELGLHGNQLSGQLPNELGNLSKILSIHLAHNNFSGNIPASLGSLSTLRELLLHANQLSGSIPPEIGSLTNLYTLALHYNQLTGSIPASIGMLSKLNTLYLYNNQLTGSLPATINGLINLTELGLHGNQLSGQLPNELGNLPKILSINLAHNNFSGNIPSSLGSLSTLRELTLHSNQLSGSIPPEIGSLINLYTLTLHYNQLTGPIPSSIGSLSSLNSLSLYNNQLTGPIPSTFGGLINLTELGLHSNQLSGALPVAIGNLPKIQSINLSFNNFSGSIPPSLGSIPTLTQINLVNNQFTFSDFLEVKANFSGTSFSYLPQAFIDSEKTLQAPIGSPYTLTTTIDRNTTPASVYRWYKKVNGVITPLNEASATGHTVELPAITQADNGTQYYYTITNTAAPGLTLTSHLQTLAATTCQTPVLDFQFEEVNGTHTFNPSLSNADNCTITYSWDFGDGTTSHDQVGNHDYAAVGSYTVVLTVNYQCGACASSTLTKEYVVSITNNVLCQSIYCDGNGGVGIGTRKTQGFALSVNGKIRASDIIKVYPHNQWADFVFDRNYKLRPLNEVELFIKRNGHLPEIPSAAQVEKEGVDLGAMDAKLLQKIEELTLYIIKQDKEIQELKKLVKSKQ